MKREAVQAGNFNHEIYNIEIPILKIITIDEILSGKRIDVLLKKSVYESANSRSNCVEQSELKL